ncbi:MULTISPECIES: lipoyl(octanoyl) transferase LipB [unclassified Curtobacterium]|uniref:lipoyl(octanoyl) transferase LipB n=1 Tax=unclassified Curtobacterium TaxID=257496 RepID=UPI000F495E10|nr:MULTISPECIES: lipoyl(octanoyl) transferase LipB [unclassified Curtobacterium]ROQ07314.1 lipoyl(octanoyl) transferase [Curtobacterium sp. PhB171]ROQ24074.1 lipoyl(octanoyl) transferase [Curtobacterium sp. PhB170]ROS35988.1 lipoyl(octanoyl) transferase [Curtobacterium sp. PhB131]ROS70097.1 lipoyl(octanoyl) transferase [Curtobacterium sp. PhB141]
MTELEIVRPAGLLDYAEGLALQRDLLADVVAGRSPGALVLCEHPSVYTAGRRTEPSDLPTNGAPVVDVDRGGRITWHGPGQLVAYPIVRLAVPIDVVAWVRDLEQVIIDAAATVGVDARRIDGRSGAWTSGSAATTGASPAKVGAIGLHVAEGVTTHGIAINCDNALDVYAAIVPCGIADAGVTTLSAAAGRPVTVADLADVVVNRIRAAEHGMHNGDRISRAARSAASISSAATSTASTSTLPARQETLV